MKRKLMWLASVGSASVLLAGCASFTGDSSAGEDTAVMAITSDIGNLDPVSQSSNDLTQFKNLTYDRLVNENATTGDVEPVLASSWEEDLKQLRLTIDNDATCEDGSEIDAEVVAANYERIVAPDSTSSSKGNAVPADLQVEVADKDVILTTETEFPFFLRSAATIPIVCQAGLDDEEALKEKTFGTGPFVLDKVVSGSEYQLSKREGYTWGPGGASTDEEDFPEKLVLRVVENETTAANLLLSGELNIAAVQGPDRERVEEAGIDSQTYEIPLGELWFNHDDGRVTASEPVRRAVVKALKLDELGSVVTSGEAKRPESTMTLTPVACPADVVDDLIPETDLDEARTILEQDGWKFDADTGFTKDGEKLSLDVIYQTKWGQAMADGAELLSNQLNDFGIVTEIRALDAPASGAVIFGDGEFDIAWNPFTMDNPRLLVPLVMGENPRNDGLNFGSIDNAEHDALASEALALPGMEGCDKWNAAEKSLVEQLNVVPFASGEVPIFTSGVTAEVAKGSIAPWSIRIIK